MKQAGGGSRDDPHLVHPVGGSAVFAKGGELAFGPPEMGAQLRQCGCGQQCDEVFAGKQQSQRFAVGQAGQIEGGGILKPTPAIGLGALIYDQGEDAGEGLQITLNGAFGNFVTVRAELGVNVGGGNTARMAWDQTQLLPLAL